MSVIVSIIIPVYNVEPYILRCLNSVKEQYVTDGIECIIVDDCGSDNSVLLAEQFVNEYKGNISFKIYHNERNIGLSGARNLGISKSRGKYLYFLDSDDEITPNCIECFFHIAEEYPDVDFIQGLFKADSEYMKQFLDKDIPTYTEDAKKIKSMLLDYDAIPVTAHNRFIKTEIIKNNGLYFREGIIHEDNYWAFFLSKHISSFAYCNNQGYIYYTNPGSIMTTIDRAKEMNASQVMLREFSSNIDSFMQGEQKRAILYVLINILNNKYYDSTEEKLSLINCFIKKNTFLERIILNICLKITCNTFLYQKMVSVLIRVYRLKNN